MATNAVSWFRPIFGNEILKLRSKNCEDPFETKTMDSLIPAKRGDDSKPSEDNGTDHVIGVYFTPLFCDNGLQSGYQSYQELTKMLIEFYNVINMNSGELKKLEVIQVFVPPSINQCSIVNLESNEETLTKFREALLDVPWFALPLQDEIRRVRLKHRYQATDGAVVLLSARTGNILCRDCRERIREDPEGVHFPWLPRPTLQVLQEAAQGGLLPGGIKKGEGEKRILYESLDGYVKGIYFSAHWCPPCKAFTPQLIETYKKIRSRGHKFEIIFVSSDRSEESFETYLSTMPWTAVPYSKSTQRQELALQFDVHGIPTLVLIDTDGSLITADGRGEVNEDPDGECFPWRKRLVNILTDRLATTLYHSPAIVLFLEGEDDEEVDFAENVLTPSAEWVLQNEENMDYQLNFFIALDSDTSESLRDFVGIEDASPLLTAIDFPINRFSTMEYGEEITPASVKTFVCNFVSNKLKCLPVISTQEVV